MDEAGYEIYAILLAGGTGTRLWPVSRQLYPKQLVKFIGDDSLVQSTIKRLTPVLDLEHVRIVCGEQHFHETARHLEGIGLSPEGKIITEPAGRNTAAAILLAVLHTRVEQDDAVLCVFPADHVISDIGGFHLRLRDAIELAARDFIVTFGIRPTYPETGYGYVEGGQKVSRGALRLKRFVEKPDEATARRYIEAGNFFWNSGMFVFKASVILEEFQTHQPAMLEQMQAIFAPRAAIALRDYSRLPDISIDYAIMEQTTRGVVLPSDFGWSDIGSWKSLYDFLPKDDRLNVIDGDVITHNTRNCFILGRDRLIATNHLDGLVVVETPDSVFVSDLDHSRDVKSIVARLKEGGRKEYQQHRTVHFPWGSRTLLEQKDDAVVIRLVIYPGADLKLPAAGPGGFHLVAVNGDIQIQRAGKTGRLKAGESALFKNEDAVCLENTCQQAVSLIQVQLGRDR